MAAQLVDLHLHSTFSDGRYTPTMLVDEAVAKGISVIAITDHDSWNGMAEAREAAKGYGGRIRVLTGIELGTQYEDDAVHILGYHVSMDCEALHKKMDEMRHAREHRLYAMLEKLEKLGYHVAKGYFATVQEVFDALLHRGGPAYVPQPKLSPQEAVALIHKAGGIAVLAHPSELVDKTLPERLLAAEPFDGIEVWHPSADVQAQAHWLALAKQRGLLVSGGSDFHGIPDRFPTKLGIWQVQYDDVKGVIEWK